jgi:hypothetical protein
VINKVHTSWGTSRRIAASHVCVAMGGRKSNTDARDAAGAAL